MSLWRRITGAEQREREERAREEYNAEMIRVHAEYDRSIEALEAAQRASAELVANRTAATCPNCSCIYSILRRGNDDQPRVVIATYDSRSGHIERKADLLSCVECEVEFVNTPTGPLVVGKRRPLAKRNAADEAEAIARKQSEERNQQRKDPDIRQKPRA